MTIGFIVWLILILWLLGGVAVAWPRDAPNRYGFGSNLVLWVVLALLAWSVYGSPLKG